MFCNKSQKLFVLLRSCTLECSLSQGSCSEIFFKQSMVARNRVGIWLSYRAGIFKQSMGARNQVGIGLPYRPARVHRLEELISWNLFMGFIEVQQFGLRPARLHRLAELISWNDSCARNYRPCFRENQPKRSFSFK